MLRLEIKHILTSKLNILTILFGVWAIISFSLPRYFDAHNSFDHSWMTALAQTSSYKAFSYGPLSWLFLPDLSGFDLFKVILRFLLCSILFYPLIEFFDRSSWKRKLLIFFGVLFTLAAPYFKYDVLFYLSFWFLLFDSEKRTSQWLILIWVLTAPLYKFSFLPMAIILSFGPFLSSKIQWKWSLGGLCIILFSQLIFDSFFLEKIEYSLGYSEYMAAHQEGSFFIAFSIILFSIGISLLLIRNKAHLWPLFLCSIFIQYKHGVVLGTPGYAFYLFFHPFYFLVLRFKGTFSTILTCLSVWMIPFYIHYMGGVFGLADKFSKSIVFKSNLPVEISLQERCPHHDKKIMLLDYFGDAIGSSCKLETLPSVQFYGFSPVSSISALNAQAFQAIKAEKLFFSPLTFGGRNAVSEMSYLLKDLIQDYRLEKGEPLSRFSKDHSDEQRKLFCSKDVSPTKLAFLKLGCSDFVTVAYQAIQGFLYKYPEFFVEGEFKQRRVFYSSLVSGVYIYLGEHNELYNWWNTIRGIPQFSVTKPVVRVLHGGGFFSSRMEKSINECLEVAYCQIVGREQK